MAGKPSARKNQHLDDTINLMDYIGNLWHYAWAIVLAAVICGGAMFAYAAYYITPLYKATALMYVNNSSFSVGSTSFSISSSELTAAQSLVSTYQVILKSRTTLEEVIEEAGLKYSYSRLNSMISTSTVNDTEIFSITVTSPDPEEAELIANTVANVLPGRISEVIDGSSVRIVDAAVVPTRKSSPNITDYTTKGILFGLGVSCFIICLLTALDDVVYGEDDLLKSYDIPVLAVIPDMLDDRMSSGYYYKNYYKSPGKAPAAGKETAETAQGTRNGSRETESKEACSDERNQAPKKK